MLKLAENALVLYPANSESQAPLADFMRLLQELQLLGAAFEAQQGTAYLPGATFAQHLSFMGCAPAIDSALPSAGASTTNFYSLRCISSATLEFLGNQATRAPRCPHCNSFLPDWENQLAGWQQQAAPLFLCPGCAQTSPPWAWHWRKRGGFARTALWIHGVFEGEAIPGQSLLQALKNLTQSDWQYGFRVGF